MVFKVFELINNHTQYDKYKKGYFVDRDFDSQVSTSYKNLIYETPTYSIENFYIKDQCISEILKNEFGILEIEDSYKNCLKFYKERLNEYLDAISLFNAWYCCLKQYKEINRLPSTGVILNDKFPKNYLCFSLYQITVSYNYDNLINDFPDSLKISFESINQKEKEMKNFNRIDIFRGKYLFDFLHKLLNLIISDSNTNQIVVKIKIKYNVEYVRMISLFSQYAYTPECLITYLKAFN